MGSGKNTRVVRASCALPGRRAALGALLALPATAYAISKANYDTVRAKILRRER